MSPRDSTPLKVLIIGAGSAGLLLAHMFKKAGIDAVVFEQDASLTARPRDWSFGVYWAQSQIEECLPPELIPLLDSTQPDPGLERTADDVMHIFNGQTGEVAKAVPSPFCFRMRRRAWLDVIRTGINVHFGKRLDSITTAGQEVTAKFTDGTSEAGNLLIGADGASSLTRRWLFRSCPRDGALVETPIVTSATVTKLVPDIAVAVRGLNPRHFLCMVEGLVMFVSLQECLSPDPADWLFMVIVTWRDEDEDVTTRRDSAELLDELNGKAKGLASPFREILTTIPRGTKIWHSRMRYWPTRLWHVAGNDEGLVTLAGDAAHPVTFHRGQGLGNAIADVAEFQKHVQAMAAHTPAELAKAVEGYEQEVRVRGYETVMGNLENTLAIHGEEKRIHSPIFVGGFKSSGDKVRVPGGIDEGIADSHQVMVGDDPTLSDMFLQEP